MARSEDKASSEEAPPGAVAGRGRDHSTHIGLRAFVDELARCGVREACTSPGSRNTPLLLALVGDGRLRCTSHIDERSGAFFGLGLAKVTGIPAVLACTSGTAAANYLPAVVEAWEARVPLIVLTADRPPELRDVGAGQTIDQVKLYGRAAKWYLEVDEAPATPERLAWLRQLACRAVWTSLDGRPGPVHLNWSFREPLLPDGPLPAGGGGRAGGRPWTDRIAAPAVSGDALAAELAERPRALVVAGMGADGPAVAEFARRSRLPLLADPLSGARRGEAVAHYDALLRDEVWAAAHAPDLVLRVGDLPASKALRQWLARLDARQVLVGAAFGDPAARLDAVLPAGLPEPAPIGDPGFAASWAAADAAAREALGEALGDDLTEPIVAARVAARVPPDGALVVASSMPVRDVETFGVALAQPAPVYANRGANGIDGTVSTAFGVAAATAGPTVLLTGDLALLHDIGGLHAARRTRTRLVIVVLDNDGGGIFGFLPVAEHASIFEGHVATPHGLDLADAARLYGLDYENPTDLAGFDESLERALAAPASTMILVRTGRAENVEIHRRAVQAVARSVRPAS